MSIAAQTAIPIADGESERIITDDESNRTYLVEVIGDNPVRISHNKRYASDGTTLSAGQTHTISNLRGEELYAAAYDGETVIRVREASADVNSQPVKEIDIGEVSVNSAIGIDNYTQSFDDSHGIGVTHTNCQVDRPPDSDKRSRFCRITNCCQ